MNCCYLAECSLPRIGCGKQLCGQAAAHTEMFAQSVEEAQDFIKRGLGGPCIFLIASWRIFIVSRRVLALG